MTANIQHGRADTLGIVEFFAAGDAQHAHCLDYQPTTIEQVASETYYLAIAAEDDVAVGCATLNQDTGEIERLFVRKDRRREGIARALLAYLECTAKIEGISTITLDVLNTNWRAINLYVSAGYSLKGAVGNFLFFDKQLERDADGNHGNT